MRLYRMLNIGYKITLFTLLFIIPVSSGEMSNLLVAYHLIIAMIVSCAYGLPAFIKRRLVHGY